MTKITLIARLVRNVSAFENYASNAEVRVGAATSRLRSAIIDFAWGIEARIDYAVLRVAEFATDLRLRLVESHLAATRAETQKLVLAATAETKRAVTEVSEAMDRANARHAAALELRKRAEALHDAHQELKKGA